MSVFHKFCGLRGQNDTSIGHFGGGARTVGAGWGCGDGASAGGDLIVCAAFEAPAVVSVKVTVFERRQMTAVRKELNHEYEATVGINA
jgi:hypothetical protein